MQENKGHHWPALVPAGRLVALVSLASVALAGISLPSAFLPVSSGASPPSLSTETGPVGAYCGTQASPALAPEALGLVNAPPARAEGDTGSGVTVAVLADGLSPGLADLKRNPDYGRAGARVVKVYKDFSGDGTAAPSAGAEAFGDVSSIAAQGNRAYNLSRYVLPAQSARLPSSGCWVKVLGVAPGANLMALKVLPTQHALAISGIVQAIGFAVAHGAKVVNESFGFINFPESWLDALRDANDAAVAAGTTVVVATGDGGPANTMGSPATDPAVISVGATTSFALYSQTDEGGFYNPAVGNGRWLDDNVSALSSGGFSQAGATVDLVAPGEANWALCAPGGSTFSGCADDLGGTANGLQVFGGTSEAAPLVAGAAADVINAYSRAHQGTFPSPALVKEILTSSASDIGAPATEQGAGLLNVGAAVALARAVPAESLPDQPTPTPSATSTTTSTTTTSTSLTGPAATATGNDGALLITPSQVNLSARPGARLAAQVNVVNPTSAALEVSLATRSLSRRLYSSGTRSFTLDPVSTTSNTGTFPVWNGVREVYQTQSFTVPSTAPSTSLTRLVFTAAYRQSGQTSALHVALFTPDGTYAGYSDPQGTGGYAQVEVTSPTPGTWTALFFTEENGATVNGTGTSGPVLWDASTWAYSPGASVYPRQLTLAPGQSATARISLRAPLAAGDSAQSLVVSWPGGRATVPVTLRTTVPVSARGGHFNGVLTGGDGRANSDAQGDTYWFNIPSSWDSLQVSVTLATDPGDPVTAYLVGPDGATVAYASNYTLLPSGNGLAAGATRSLDLYTTAPEPGPWALDLEWSNPVTGLQLSEPFSGSIGPGRPGVSAHLPHGVALRHGQAKTYKVRVKDTGPAPMAVFADARTDKMVGTALADFAQVTKSGQLSLPLRPGFTFPMYVVPPQTTALQATLQRKAGKVPVTFDFSYWPGDPDISPDFPEPGVTASAGGGVASASISAQDLSSGVWALTPSEVGPYGTTGAPPARVAVSVRATTLGFDPAVSTTTDDFWQAPSTFKHFLYLRPGETGELRVTFRPKGAPGTTESGTLYVDSFLLASYVSSLLPTASEVAALPYSYTVGAG